MFVGLDLQNAYYYHLDDLDILTLSLPALFYVVKVWYSMSSKISCLIPFGRINLKKIAHFPKSLFCVVDIERVEALCTKEKVELPF